VAGSDRMTIEEVVKPVLLPEHADVIRPTLRDVTAPRRVPSVGTTLHAPERIRMTRSGTSLACVRVHRGANSQLELRSTKSAALAASSPDQSPLPVCWTGAATLDFAPSRVRGPSARVPRGRRSRSRRTGRRDPRAAVAREVTSPRPATVRAGRGLAGRGGAASPPVRVRTTGVHHRVAIASESRVRPSIWSRGDR